MNIADRTFNAIQSNPFPAQQAENAELSYTIDYTSYLQADTIDTSTWACQGLTITTSDTDTTATAKVTGSPGRYNLVNKIVTAAGNVDERTIRLHIMPNNFVPSDYA